MPLEGEVTDDVLHVGLVDRELGASQGLDLLAAPGDEDELGTLALLVTGDEADESELDLVILELALELREGARSGALEDDLGRAVIAEEGPVRKSAAHRRRAD